ncbi:MAG TPA: hypothetical protein VGS79_11070 [Puia sp.]|nr:hypothetical protein [Puia sp.]
MKPLSLMCLSACLCILWLLPCPAEGQRPPDSTNACLLLKQPVNSQSVRRNARKIITKKSDDDCVLGFIDLLANSSFGRDHRQYLACLDAICKASDGYVADDLKNRN